MLTVSTFVVIGNIGDEANMSLNWLILIVKAQTIFYLVQRNNYNGGCDSACLQNTKGLNSQLDLLLPVVSTQRTLATIPTATATGVATLQNANERKQEGVGVRAKG